MKEKTKKNRGRPSKYVPALCKSLVDYFSNSPYTIKDMVIEKSDGIKIGKTVFEPGDLPLFSGWCAEVGIDDDTMLNWAKSIPEFFGAYKKAKQLQQRFLVTNGLHGLYNPAFAIFTAKNILGWRDQNMLIDQSTKNYVQIYRPEPYSREEVEASSRPANRSV